MGDPSRVIGCTDFFLLACLEDSLFSSRIEGVVWASFVRYFKCGYKAAGSFAVDKKPECGNGRIKRPVMEVSSQNIKGQ